MHAVATEVVLLALQHRHPHARGVRGDGGGVLLGQLVLQVLGGRRHDDALPAHGGRDQIGERFADPGARFDNGGFSS